MSAPRVERVKRQLLREATAVLQDLRDPRIGFVTVTHAEVSADLRNAKIFVSIFGSITQQEETFQVLSGASSFVRTQIGHRMRLRYTPEILFVKDESSRYVDRVFTILEEIKNKETQHGAN